MWLLKSVPPTASSCSAPPCSSRGLGIPDCTSQTQRQSQESPERKFSNAAATVTSYLSQTLRTPPVSLGDIVEGWDQAKGVVTVITSITQEKPVLVTATAAQEADIEVHLQPWKMGREQGDVSCDLTL